jgi:hypothetical protein
VDVCKYSSSTWLMIPPLVSLICTIFFLLTRIGRTGGGILSSVSCGIADRCLVFPRSYCIEYYAAERYNGLFCASNYFIGDMFSKDVLCDCLWM